jgi:hypothetical protein
MHARRRERRECRAAALRGVRMRVCGCNLVPRHEGEVRVGGEHVVGQQAPQHANVGLEDGDAHVPVESTRRITLHAIMPDVKNCALAASRCDLSKVAAPLLMIQFTTRWVQKRACTVLAVCT